MYINFHSIISIYNTLQHHRSSPCLASGLHTLNSNGLNQDRLSNAFKFSIVWKQRCLPHYQIVTTLQMNLQINMKCQMNKYMIFWCVLMLCTQVNIKFLGCYSECLSTPARLKSLPDHGGNRTHDL